MSSHPIQAPASEQKIASMFDRIAQRYDLLNALLSARQDRRWRKHLVASVPYRPEGSFLDVATGTGDVILEVAQKHPEYARFVGVDISTNMLELARIKQQRTTLGGKLKFSLMSAERLDYPNDSFDALSISFGLRNVIDRLQAIQEFHRVLKKEGKL